MIVNGSDDDSIRIQGVDNYSFDDADAVEAIPHLPHGADLQEEADLQREVVDSSGYEFEGGGAADA